MWKVLLWTLGKRLLTSLPVERVLAILLNKMLDKVGGKRSYGKAVKTSTHLAEIVQVLNVVLADGKIAEDEIDDLNEIRTSAKALIAVWAKGDTAPELESKVLSS